MSFNSLSAGEFERKNSVNESIAKIKADIRAGLIVSPCRIKRLIDTKRKERECIERFAAMPGETGERARKAARELDDETAGYERALKNADYFIMALEREAEGLSVRDIVRVFKLRDMRLEWEAEALKKPVYTRYIRAGAIRCEGAEEGEHVKA
jgi:hypothetical protein